MITSHCELCGAFKSVTAPELLSWFSNEKMLALCAVWRGSQTRSTTLRRRLYYLRILETLAEKGVLGRFLAGSTKAPTKRRKVLEKWSHADWEPENSVQMSAKRRKVASAMSVLEIDRNLRCVNPHWIF